MRVSHPKSYIGTNGFQFCSVIGYKNCSYDKVSANLNLSLYVNRRDVVVTVNLSL